MNVDWPWIAYVWLAAIALAIGAAVLTAVSRRERLVSLPAEHAAGAALVGFFGWEALVNLPDTVSVWGNLIAGLGPVPGTQPYLAYLVGQAAFAIAAAVAVAGIVRRHPWGAVLGIGLAIATIVSSGLQVAQLAVLYGDSIAPEAWSGLLVSIIGMRMVPALAAIVLLARPLLGRGRAEEAVEPALPGATAIHPPA